MSRQLFHVNKEEGQYRHSLCGPEGNHRLVVQCPAALPHCCVQDLYEVQF